MTPEALSLLLAKTGRDLLLLSQDPHPDRVEASIQVLATVITALIEEPPLPSNVVQFRRAG